MNIRFSTLFGLLVITLAALGLYGVKYKVQAVREQVALAGKQLKEEREALHVIEVEWSYLNRPQRLQELAQKHLKLAPMKGEQIMDLASVPDMAVMVAKAEAEEKAKAAAAAKPVEGLWPASATMPEADGFSYQPGQAANAR